MNCETLGELAVSSGLVTGEQLRAAVERQSELSRILLGQVLIRTKVVSQTTLDKALEDQIREVSNGGLVKRRMLGEVLVDQQLITEEELKQTLKEQTRLRKLNIGQVLVEMGAISLEDYDKLIAMSISEHVGNAA